jgi:hypothetical protein
MRTLLVALASLGLAHHIHSQTPANNEYRYPEGRVKFRMDPKPKYERSVIKTKSGEQSVTTITASKSSDLILTVSYSDLPDSGRPLEVDKIYESTLKAMSKNGTQVEERTLDAKAALPSGKEVLLVHGKISTRARLFLDGHRLYVVSAVGSASKVQDKSANELFQHFEIVPSEK